MSLDGSLNEIPNFNNSDYAIRYLDPAKSYIALKVEWLDNMNEKRYTALLDQRWLTASILSNRAQTSIIAP